MVTEAAFAKINLWLTVRGRRADGYHDLASVAVFAELSDQITAQPAPDWGLAITGPQAGQLSPSRDNLVLGAALAFAEQFGSDRFHFTLEKNIPVAAGLGGGSADAAAVLRILARQKHLLEPGSAASTVPALVDLAARLGADIPVCLDGLPAHMSGTGVVTTPAIVGSGAVVLINPRIALSTARVFAGLGLKPGQARSATPSRVPPQSSGDQWLATALAAGNDLENVACRLVPEIGEILEWLAGTDQCRLARMTGSGPTCFGLYRDITTAQAAHTQAQARFPDWWVAVSPLRT